MKVQWNCFLLATLLMIAYAAAPTRSAAQSPAPMPDFSGVWRHGSLPWLIPPESGPGPVTNRSRRKDTGQSNYGELVGDYTNPILQPWMIQSSIAAPVMLGRPFPRRTPRLKFARATPPEPYPSANQPGKFRAALAPAAGAPRRAILNPASEPDLLVGRGIVGPNIVITRRSERVGEDISDICRPVKDRNVADRSASLLR